ncbi:DivIVA domain-containing protein [Labedaea rhizosphaerae]|nr:DivIVA domain-containing protein [Labedaea rhizosphaerae]
MAPPWLTARDIGEAVFDQARLTRRGYDEDQVDAFLDRVADTIVGMTAELAAASREVDRLRHWHQQHGASPAALATMSHAEADAERIIAEAHEHARKVAQEAAAIRAEAARQAQQILAAIHSLADEGTVDQRYAAMAAILVGTRDHLTDIRAQLTDEVSRLDSLLSPSRQRNGASTQERR